MGPILISIMTLVAAGFFGYFAWQRFELLTFAAPENRLDRPAERFWGLIEYGIFQKRLVSHHKNAGWMHAMIFWGFLALLLRSILMWLTGFDPQAHLPGVLGDGYTAFKDVVEALVLVMVCYAAFRRIVLKPERLTNSAEAYLILVLIGTLMVTDFMYDAARYALFSDPSLVREARFAVIGHPLSTLVASWPNAVLAAMFKGAYWVHMAVLMAFAVFLTKSKHMHVITALPNVFLRALGQPGLAIKPLDLADETAESFGATTIKDLTWKQDLDLFTCTECGRCFSSCPTYVTHKPLSLKGLNSDLKHHLYDQVGATTEPPALVGNVISADTVWACTTCGFCETSCPVFIEQVPRIVSMRQSLTLMEASYPEELKKLYTGLERSSNPWNIPAETRADWAEGLGVMTMAEAKAQNKPIEMLYYVGCMGSFDSRSQKVAKALVKILQEAGISFAIMGKEEGCNGDSARRLGNEYLFQELARYTIDKFESYNVKTVLTACPHCMNTIKNEYPQFGGNYRVVHHTEFVLELLSKGQIKVNKQFSDVLFHDSCYLGRYNQIYQQPRAIVELVSQNAVKEFDRHHENSFCCGAGGGRMWMEETLGEPINRNRAEEGLKENPKVMASACPFCLTMLRDGVGATGKGDAVQTMDIVELVAEAMVAKSPAA